jgi:hypothetical protein
LVLAPFSPAGRDDSLDLADLSAGADAELLVLLSFDMLLPVDSLAAINGPDNMKDSPANASAQLNLLFIR